MGLLIFNAPPERHSGNSKISTQEFKTRNLLRALKSYIQTQITEFLDGTDVK